MINKISREDIAKIDELVKRLDKVAAHMVWGLAPSSFPKPFVLMSDPYGTLTVRTGVTLLGETVVGVVYHDGKKSHGICQCDVYEKLLYLENAYAFFKHLRDELDGIKTRIETCLRATPKFVEEMEKEAEF